MKKPGSVPIYFRFAVALVASVMVIGGSSAPVYAGPDHHKKHDPASVKELKDDKKPEAEVKADRAAEAGQAPAGSSEKTVPAPVPLPAPLASGTTQPGAAKSTDSQSEASSPAKSETPALPAPVTTLPAIPAPASAGPAAPAPVISDSSKADDKAAPAGNTAGGATNVIGGRGGPEASTKQMEPAQKSAPAMIAPSATKTVTEPAAAVAAPKAPAAADKTEAPKPALPDFLPQAAGNAANNNLAAENNNVFVPAAPVAGERAGQGITSNWMVVTKSGTNNIRKTLAPVIYSSSALSPESTKKGYATATTLVAAGIILILGSNRNIRLSGNFGNSRQRRTSYQAANNPF